MPGWSAASARSPARWASSKPAAPAHAKTEWWFGPAIGHADITVACALRFLGDAHAGLFDLSEGWPMLAAHAAKCEAMPPFREI